jgi:hypothetical protein
MNKNQRALLLIALAAAIVSHLQAQALQPRIDGALLRVAAPQLRFLPGRILERLHNGAAVPFQFQLSANSGGHTLEQATTRFVLSYDLWEERYSIQQTDAGKRAASHLAQDAAEAWCLENLSLPVSALAGEKTFVLKLEIRAEEAKEDSTDAKPSFSMAGLIDVFSRKPKEEPLRWSAVSGPVRLQDLVPKTPNHKAMVPKL